jgi:hypothetical protein
VRRTDDAHVDTPDPLASERADLSGLEDAEKPRLEVERQLTHLVEEERSAVRLLEEAAVLVRGASEGTTRVAEQLARDERRRDRSRVHGHEGPATSCALGVERTSHELLPRAGLSRDEHGGRQAREASDLAAELAHRI